MAWHLIWPFHEKTVHTGSKQIDVFLLNLGTSSIRCETLQATFRFSLMPLNRFSITIASRAMQSTHPTNKQMPHFLFNRAYPRSHILIISRVGAWHTSISILKSMKRKTKMNTSGTNVKIQFQQRQKESTWILPLSYSLLLQPSTLFFDQLGSCAEVRGLRGRGAGHDGGGGAGDGAGLVGVRVTSLWVSRDRATDWSSNQLTSSIRGRAAQGRDLGSPSSTPPTSPSSSTLSPSTMSTLSPSLAALTPSLRWFCCSCQQQNAVHRWNKVCSQLNFHLSTSQMLKCGWI